MIPDRPAPLPDPVPRISPNTRLRPLLLAGRAWASAAAAGLWRASRRQARRLDAIDRARLRAEARLMVLAAGFFVAFLAIAGRMAVLASSEPEMRSAATTISEPILGTRADITDRAGRVLATNLATHSLYAHPQDMIDPERAATELAAIFPDLDRDRLLRDFTGDRRFVWVRRQISPEQAQRVHDIGEPGLLFGPREMRLYPNGAIAAHILGGASYGREGVHSAEVIGVAGVERFFDARLRDPEQQDEPLRLSIDLTVQAAMEEVLEGGMTLMNAKGAAGIIMDVHTGEILAMASLPDFDPNARPRPATSGDPGDSPLFNRAIQGVYELGSVFKIFAVAQALELGLVTPDTMIDTRGPMTWGRFRINDFHNYGPELSTTDVIVKSSNIGTAHIALMIGAQRQRAFLDSLGLLRPTSIEMAEAPTGTPLLPRQWSEISLLTISYGHGLSTSPLHLAAAYATIVNGGTRVVPTLLRQDHPRTGERVLSEQVSRQATEMLRQVVVRGTATFADIPGYEVGGKTGTADKPRPEGGYYDDKVIATFAGVFPASDPRYVVVVSLDEPVETSGPEPRRTAGWTAAPVAGELIRRAAPLLGLRPEVAVATPDGVTLAAN
ncbi:Cell division protein FtsI/penicillin-binding protein 2 [Rubellimicrobium thermophilum DSM 16684]|uniref:Cell division protein FtsI/penicillin-binding protein 2 n=1 Tax=Rubellimicrobium thermophilum DSM 16684 TaxID=1123069 RepID=S9R3L3_9RHOB|nr:penicillin-binding protein 2 [Rubellimicrobium thermophilum]EPX86563.1 Cell division protein FtsI/penicillin-binding protein 2 [Rubellimicrobium thermophilum DSM 16684]